MNDYSPNLQARARVLLAAHQDQIYRRTDRMFAVLMVLQWAAAIGNALWLSPQTWSGDRSTLHPHVWLAVAFGGVLCVLPVTLAIVAPGKLLTRHTIAVAQVLFSSLLIHISGGRIETHFHVFGSLAFLAAYRDWKVLIPATIVVAIDHFVRGVYFPESVFGVMAASPWRWLEHAGWVIFEDVFLIIVIRQSVAEMQASATQTAQLELNHAQLKEAKEQAEAANATKSEFLANMSHEIRTPLTGILGFAEVMRLGENTPEEREHYLAVIQSSGQHLLSLINDILDLSKVEAGHMECERISCSPHEVFAEVLSVLRVRAQEKGLSLTCTWTSPIPEKIVTDPARLRQLLMNLTANAVKFTERGGVDIRAAIDNQGEQPKLVCEIEDTGIGIQPENLERIFQPFNQADNSITRQFGGTGLGLTICRHIADRLGGSVHVESQPGQGSVFRFEIETGPLDDVNFLDESFHESLQTGRSGSQTSSTSRTIPAVRVLLVDDGETNRKLISLVLTRAGAIVECAENGQEAVDQALRGNFHLILMDMQMPVMDGYTATRKLRSLGFERPIVALTAHAMRDDQEKCLAAGCTGYLSKPVVIDDLIETVSAAAQRPAMDSSTTLECREPILSTLATDLPEFQSIVDSYLATFRDKLAEMQAALADREWQTLAELAHWLKGSGGTVGFHCLTVPAANLEQNAKDHDPASARRTINELRDLAERMGAHAAGRDVCQTDLEATA